MYQVNSRILTEGKLAAIIDAAKPSAYIPEDENRMVTFREAKSVKELVSPDVLLVVDNFFKDSYNHKKYYMDDELILERSVRIN